MTAPERGAKLLCYVAGGGGRRAGKNSNDLAAVCVQSTYQAQIYTGTLSRPGSSPWEGLHGV